MTTEPVPEVPSSDVLDEVVLDALDTLDAPEESEGFRIDNEGNADWAARKLAKTRSALVAATVLATRQKDAILDAVRPHLDAIDRWYAAERDRREADAERWEALLADYHRAVLRLDDRAKTIRLPHATLSARKNPDRWETDDEKVIEWAQTANPAILRTKVEIDRREMKQALVNIGGTATFAGEIVPGVTVLPGETKFSVETNEVER